MIPPVDDLYVNDLCVNEDHHKSQSSWPRYSDSSDFYLLNLSGFIIVADKSSYPGALSTIEELKKFTTNKHP
jgi:hypothetical protein